MRLPFASWCVGASSLHMRREKIVRPYYILSMVAGLGGVLLRTTF